LWALAGEQVPFKVSRESWSDKVHQYYLVDRVEISKWPYGFAWGDIIGQAPLGETEKIRSAGTYAWRAVEEVAAAPVVAEGESPPR